MSEKCCIAGCEADRFPLMFDYCWLHLQSKNTFRFCAEDSCECVVYDNMYCPEHKLECLALGCSTRTGHETCVKHTCVTEDCSNIIVKYNSGHCKQCRSKCAIARCRDITHDDAKYCKLHSCKSCDDRPSIPELEFIYCGECGMKCNTYSCAVPVSVKRRHCQRHRCSRCDAALYNDYQRCYTCGYIKMI
jgi:hypothetical protein